MITKLDSNSNIKSNFNRHQDAVGGNGLVPCDKSDRNTKRKDNRRIQAEVFADVVVIHQERGTQDTRRRGGGGTRRNITVFSRKSRTNMLRTWGKVRRPERPLFCTLTYPDSVIAAHPGGAMAARAKRDMAALRKRMARKWSHAAGFWRIEFVTRKSGALIGQYAPHFHVVVLGVLDDVADIREWLRAAWYEIAHDGDEHNGRAAIQVDTARNRRHATFYMAKYTAKQGEDDGLTEYLKECPPGRWWGTFGNMDTSSSGIVGMTWGEFRRLRRLVSRWLKNRNRRFSRQLKRRPEMDGFTVFGLGDESSSSTPNAPPPILTFLRAARLETA